MRALIMAGGMGSRLGRGEKGLVLIHNQPMIWYVIEACRLAGCDTVVVTSTRTPMTANWCRAHGLPIVCTEGKGYVADMVSAVQELEETRPVLTCVSDIPCITSNIITAIIHEYHVRGRDSLSTWVPATHVKSCRGGMPYREIIGGIEACPAGINILRGDLISSEQDESQFMIADYRLAMNVNTLEDLIRAEHLLSEKRDQSPKI